MNNSFEYLDIILIAMIAAFIILRLRGTLGRRTGHEKKTFGNPYSKKVTRETSEEKVDKFDLKPIAKIIAHASFAMEPIYFG